VELARLRERVPVVERCDRERERAGLAPWRFWRVELAEALGLGFLRRVVELEVEDEDDELAEALGLGFLRRVVELELVDDALGFFLRLEVVDDELEALGFFWRVLAGFFSLAALRASVASFLVPGTLKFSTLLAKLLVIPQTCQ
jgi:hypothetical protein